MKIIYIILVALISSTIVSCNGQTKSSSTNVLKRHGNEIGKVTSGTQSPSLEKAIGLGYVKTAFSKIDAFIYIKVREKMLKAKVVKTPFYKAN